MRTALFAVISILAACMAGAREDRSVAWSGSGERVTFQHADEGVFVAGADGIQRIYRPNDDVAATSTPLWSPDGKRLIFATARVADGNYGLPLLRGGFGADDPAGNRFARRPARYTCWLRDKGYPVALFQADVADIGYVAANLAVRWHPSGRAVLFIARTDGGPHAVFSFDLAARTTRRVCPVSDPYLLFDWAPDREHLVCVTGSAGILVGRPGGGDWWRVPRSGLMFVTSLDEVRAARPAWAPDGRRFAYAVPGALRLADAGRRTTRLLARGDDPWRDLHWTPDGTRLGGVRGETLRIFVPGEPIGRPVGEGAVRRFAGWNAKGDRFAYTTPDVIPYSDGPLWSFLLVPDPFARDAVHEVSAAGDRIVFRGMRVTFPQWSPADDRLSLWFTFCPTHRAPISRLIGRGLRPGDPAALFTPATGAIDWLTVNAFEEAQVGHYHLLHHRDAEAWRWYGKASHGVAPRRAALRRPGEQALFESICLARLGRAEEAARKYAEFRGNFLSGARAGPAAEVWRGLASSPLVGALVRDLFEAEVLLSLDDAGEAVARFARDTDAPPAGRLARAIVLGQLRLLRGEYGAYAELCTSKVAPGLLAYRADDATLGPIVEIVTALALMPLFDRRFIDALPDVQVHRLVPRWEALRGTAADDRGRLVADLVLRALQERLGDPAERAEAHHRVRTNPAKVDFLPRGDVADAVAVLRLLVRWW